MFSYVLIALLAFLFIFVSEAAFIVFGGFLMSLLFIGTAKFVKRGLPMSRGLRLALTILVLILLVLASSWIASAQIADEMEFFIDHFPEALDEFLVSVRRNAFFHQVKEQAEQGEWMKNFIAPKILPKTAKLATVFVNGLAAFGIALALGIYFALDSRRYTKILRDLVPRNKEEKFIEFFKELGLNLQRWLWGKLLSMAGVGVLTYLGLVLLGVKAPFPLAFIASFLSFIPNAGPIISAIPAMVLAFSQGWHMVLYVALLYIVVQLLEGMLLTPMIQKKGVRLLPAGLIAFQFFMAVIYGFGGLFMATPLLVALMTTVNEFWVKSPSR